MGVWADRLKPARLIKLPGERRTLPVLRVLINTPTWPVSRRGGDRVTPWVTSDR